MNDVIHLLPDIVANQIAAGEVVQRPASAVKELLENAIDAKASNIQLIVRNAGSDLIQVIDNGTGMSFTDARMCFERHATSKIKSADDLQSLATKGFRGEALASIAAIAQVELKTRLAADPTGTRLLIEGGNIKEHTPEVCAAGTSIAVKNLFFNIPARRNFLKSPSIEMGHIEEEFFRVALIHPGISFSLTHNEKILFKLKAAPFAQRVIHIFGNHFKEKLVPVELNTEHVAVSGVIAKPENAKKKKSEQYLFVNHRFVKHYLLNHAIESAYAELIPEGYKPAFFIHIEVEPSTIDVNISPTKIDVKLQDERLIYGFLQSTVKRAIGEFSLTPRLDFETEKSMDFSNFKPSGNGIVLPRVSHNPTFNPFENNGKNHGATHGNMQGKNHPTSSGSTNTSTRWEQFLQGLKQTSIDVPSKLNDTPDTALFYPADTTPDSRTLLPEPFNYLLLEDKYLLFLWGKRITIIHVLHARERILFERFLEALQNKPVAVQQMLFPETIVLSTANAEILNELKNDLYKLGYAIEPMSTTHFAVTGIPTGAETEPLQQMIEDCIASYKSYSFLQKNGNEHKLALSMARQKRAYLRPLQNEIEVADFVKQLFACQLPDTTPSGHKIIHFIGEEMLKTFFE
ncbi:MAG: DNA mismatch repair endonuclease MutL [Bacteroidales bacterium]|jgi:DNA mismatch repair protein MutL|nr:DNA mismatch repair endonuclease MutL [Bacteroidales bacterium]